jgi:hypothetical protein
MTVSQMRSRALTLVLLFGVLIVGQSIHAAAPLPGVVADRQKGEFLPTPLQILGWLPPDTETLVVCKGPYTLEPPPRDDEKAVALPLENYLQGQSYAPLCCIHDGAYLKQLGGQEVALAVEGSRHFQPAQCLGLYPYEGCHILVFRRPLGPAGDALRKALSRDAKGVEKLAGQEVFVFQEKLEEDLWTFFVAQPRPNVLLCATHDGYLKEVLQRMAGKTGKRAFPEDLAEWRHVDKGARFWAIRHYNENEPPPATAALPATGFTFVYDPGRGSEKVKTAKVKCLSTVKDPEKSLVKWWTFNPGPWIPTAKQREPGVIEITAEMKEGEAFAFLYMLLCHLGHVINC